MTDVVNHVDRWRAVNVNCVDTGFLTLSQYILLDPFLLLFISATVLCYVEFTSVQTTHGSAIVCVCVLSSAMCVSVNQTVIQNTFT